MIVYCCGDCCIEYWFDYEADIDEPVLQSFFNFWAQVAITCLMARVNENTNVCLCHGGPLRFVNSIEHAWGGFVNEPIALVEGVNT